jgi:hypothetical protein
MMKTLSMLVALAAVLSVATGCGKKVNTDKTLDCATKQPYKSEDDCKACCGGDFKLNDTVCLCYE